MFLQESETSSNKPKKPGAINGYFKVEKAQAHKSTRGRKRRTL